jgi:glutamate/aspartate transport system substrate-binding protein
VIDLPIRKVLLPALLLAVWQTALAGVPAAVNATTDTLEKIRQTKTLLVGVRKNAIPFAYLDGAGKPIGYSVDICNRIVEAVKAELKIKDLNVSYVPLESADRIPALLENRADMECGSTTNTLKRQEQVAFSYSTFVTGVRLVAKKSSKIAKNEDLAGQVVALTKGTTAESLVKAALGSYSPPVVFLMTDSNDASFEAVKSGKAVAFFNDEILLKGLIGKSKNPDEFDVIGKFLSIEPYGIMLRKNDAALQKIVDSTIQRLFSSMEIFDVYKRWFVNQERQVPMNYLFKDGMRHPNKYPAWPG